MNITRKNGAFHISLLNGGKSYQCAPGESLLSAMARTGSNGIPLGCRGGGCGVCRIKIQSGQYNARPMSREHIDDNAKAANIALACRVFPTTDMEVYAIGNMDRLIW